MGRSVSDLPSRYVDRLTILLSYALTYLLTYSIKGIKGLEGMQGKSGPQQLLGSPRVELGRTSI